jgi:hypothetical protein
MNVDDNGIMWMGTESGDLDAFQISSQKFFKHEVVWRKKEMYCSRLIN